MIPLILKRAPVGDNQDDYSVLENGVKVGRIFKAAGRTAAPQGRQMGVGERPLGGHGQARGIRLRGDTRAAMAAFAKSWRVSFDFDVVQNGRDIPNWGCAPK
jgi:hypothetical protein